MRPNEAYACAGCTMVALGATLWFLIVLVGTWFSTRKFWLLDDSNLCDHYVSALTIYGLYSIGCFLTETTTIVWLSTFCFFSLYGMGNVYVWMRRRKQRELQKQRCRLMKLLDDIDDSEQD